jgi:hypothetical protein
MSRREYWAVAASLAACLLLAGFLSAPWLLAGAPRDPHSLCRPSGRLGHTLVLVDKSDPWSPVQADRLKLLVKQLAEALPRDHMLSIYVFRDVFEPNFPPLLALCNPGRTVSEWIGNPRRDYRRWLEQFGRPLDQALVLLAQPAQGQHSPIVEAVGDLLARRETTPESGGLRLVLVSDMLQNSAGFSFYGHATSREPGRLQRLISQRWRSGGGWSLEVRQVQGTYDQPRLEQAATLWQALLQDLRLAFTWDRL